LRAETATILMAGIIEQFQKANEPSELV